MKSIIIEPVVDEKSHRKALRQIEQLWDAALQRRLGSDPVIGVLVIQAPR